jgi:hypothetical protein
VETTGLDPSDAKEIVLEVERELQEQEIQQEHDEIAFEAILAISEGASIDGTDQR